MNDEHNQSPDSLPNHQGEKSQDSDTTNLSSPPPPREFSAGEQYPVSFAIFAMARSHKGLTAQLLREIGLFPGQEILLFQLWDRDAQSQNSLGRALRLDHSTVAKSVKRLEEAGLVSRSRSPEDGRVTLVSLTDAGRALEQRVTEVWQHVEQATTEGFTEEEMATLTRLSLKAAANADKHLK
ncbi:MarR family winged helix-turn-helix transcriptional regulator [Saccharibacillus sacchari]|uniref:MarR family winged helix-turn-helix transcriptional regulator n=1 Tax=Saccharibacillus sacchari TaxID=456493 RepID=UPI0009FBFE6D|nr:MarR family winged helix-turn-helix transcriptional regulator [Saccharibacillus sacchari]